MTDKVEPSILRILDSRLGVAGAGFLVSDNHVMTCAHVVTKALGNRRPALEMPTEPIKMNFPFAAGASAEGFVEYWDPVRPTGRGDIAVIRLTEGLPPNTGPSAFISAPDLSKRSFDVLGFPLNHYHGVWAAGTVGKVIGDQSVQLEALGPSGYRVQPGFSGSPVWDVEGKGIIGMVVTAERDATARVAFMLPVALLQSHWPCLSVQGIGPPSTQSAEPPQTASETSRFLQVSIAGIQASMVSPAASTIVADFAISFRDTREKIEKLTCLKNMHDALHDLKFSCLNLIFFARRLFPDKSVSEVLITPEVLMQEIAKSLNENAIALSLPEERTKWIRTLEGINSELTAFRECPSDAIQLDSIYQSLSRILNREPSYINSDLSAAAQSLSLGPLGSALEIVGERLATIGVRVGVESDLPTLKQTILNLVRMHNQAQRIDDELRRIGDSDFRNFDCLKVEWPDLSERTKFLCNNSDAFWSGPLLSDIEKLDLMLRGRESGEIQGPFLQYQSRFGIAFWHIDKNLLAICTELRKVGDSLSSLISMIPASSANPA